MLTDIIQISAALSPVLVVAFLGFKEWRSGASSLKMQIEADFKTRISQLEEKVKSLETSDTAKSVQIGKLETSLEEKEKQLSDYKALFANQNPNNLAKVLDDIASFMKNLNDQTMHQTRILEQRQERDRKVDEASAMHSGVPMMAPVMTHPQAPHQQPATPTVSINNLY